MSRGAMRPLLGFHFDADGRAVAAPAVLEFLERCAAGRWRVADL